MTEVAVVILNYNGRNFLKQFLPSVIKYSGSAKIIVADNASSDDSIQLLESEFSNQVEVLKIDFNRGYCGGYNYALKHIEARYFVLLNSDVEVTENWIDPIINLFKSDSSIAAAQPKILSYREKNKFEYAGAAGGFIDSFGYPFCRGRILNFIEEDKGQYDDTRQIFWATGACLFVRGDLYREIGGLDEDFFAHMEEIDLCWRLNRLGYKIYYDHKSTVYHVGGGTLSSSNPKKTYYNFRNGLSLLIKNLPGCAIYWKIPVRVMLDWSAALLFLLSKKPADARAVLRAHLDFFKRIRNDLKKRRALDDIGGFKTPMIFKGIIPFSFFMAGKKTFNQLLSIKNPR